MIKEKLMEAIRLLEPYNFTYYKIGFLFESIKLENELFEVTIEYHLYKDLFYMEIESDSDIVGNGNIKLEDLKEHFEKTATKYFDGFVKNTQVSLWDL